MHVLLFASYSSSHIHYETILNLIFPQHYPIMHTFLYLLALFYLAHALPAFSVMKLIFGKERPKTKNIGDQALSINLHEPSRHASHWKTQLQFEGTKVQGSSHLTVQSYRTSVLTTPREAHLSSGMVPDSCKETRFQRRDHREDEELLPKLQRQHESNRALDQNESLPCPKQARLKPFSHDDFTTIDLKDAPVESASRLQRKRSWSHFDPECRHLATEDEAQHILEWDKS